MKLLRRLLIVAILGLVAVGVAIAVLFSPAARTAVEKGVEYALGVKGEVQDVSAGLRPTRSMVGFDGLEIANPEGIAGPPFLQVGHFQVDVKTLSLLSSRVKVPVIDLDGLHLHLIQDGDRSNFGEILGHLRSLAGRGEGGAPTADEGQSSGGGTSLLLGAVHVKGVKATVQLRGIPGLDTLTETYALPDFDLELVDTAAGGSSEGKETSVGDLTGDLIEKLVELGVGEAEQYLPPEAMALLQGELDAAHIEDRLKDEAQEALDEAGEDLKEKLDENLGDEVGDALKGVLGDG